MKTKQLRDQTITLGVSLVFNILISWSLYFSAFNKHFPAFNKHFLFWGLWVWEHVKNHNIDLTIENLNKSTTLLQLLCI